MIKPIFSLLQLLRANVGGANKARLHRYAHLACILGVRIEYWGVISATLMEVPDLRPVTTVSQNRV